MEHNFKSRQELDEYMKNNHTSFSEFEKRIDYSIFKKHSKNLKDSRKRLWTRLGYVFASLLLVFVMSLGGYFLYSHLLNSKCPFEVGTYVYSAHEGNIEELGFTTESYIVLTEEELSGPGTFNIKDEDGKWSIYGQFYNCEWEDEEITFIKRQNTKYLFDNELLLWAQPTGLQNNLAIGYITNDIIRVNFELD